MGLRLALNESAKCTLSSYLWRRLNGQLLLFKLSILKYIVHIQIDKFQKVLSFAKLPLLFNRHLPPKRLKCQKIHQKLWMPRKAKLPWNPVGKYSWIWPQLCKGPYQILHLHLLCFCIFGNAALLLKQSAPKIIYWYYLHFKDAIYVGTLKADVYYLSSVIFFIIKV